ncbi:MAG: hypothetical protein GY841_09660 [FCB group bacterium]|nr:hypothetical protein [FCB group bacterium]
MRYKLRPLEPTTASVFLEMAGLRFDQICGDDTAEIAGENYFGSLSDAQPGMVVFARSDGNRATENMVELLNNCRASLILADPVYGNCTEPKPRQTIAFMGNPQLAFIRLFQKSIIEYNPGFFTMSEISPTCTVGPNVQIERGAVIGNGVSFLGNNYIAANVRLGDGVEILPGANIGCEGFGYVRDDDGSLINFPHLGGVIIEDNVTVGAGSCIDRGNFGDTILKEGCKLDDLVYIAHNAIIGRHSMICAHVSVAGAAKVGEFCRIAPSSTIRDGVEIGDKTLIGIGSCVVKNIPGGKIAYGVPARIISNRE